jgi:hypothetical protein
MYSCSNEQNPTEENDTLLPQIEEAKNNETETEDSEVVEKYDFRRAKWGMSMEEVMESEKDEPAIKTENTLDYSTFVMGIQTQIGYIFKDNELIRAGFFFLTKPETKNEYVDNYLKIKEELIKVNGEPVIDTVQQKDPSKKIDQANRGQAACDGDVIYAAQWDLPATDIQLLLRGENSECILTILYISEKGLRQMQSDRLKNQKQGS